jgi:hypothetical protein
VTFRPAADPGYGRGVRHLRSILYALVLGPAVWILTGVGFNGDLTGRARQYGSIESFGGLLLLLLAGAAYAVLIFAPISPAGPTLAGAVFLALALWAFGSPGGYASAWPAGVAKPGFDLSRPGYGLALLLAVPMLCTALSVRRWERFEPPVFPLVGAVGRSRGAAAVAGTPIAAVTTQVIPIGAGADPTEVIRISTAAEVNEPEPEPAFASEPEPEPAEPATVQPSNEAVEAEAADEADEPANEAVELANEAAEPANEAGEPANQAVGPVTEAVEAAVVESPFDEDKPTVEVTAEVKEPVPASAVAAEAGPEALAEPAGEKTVEASAEAEEDKTQVIKLPAADDATHDLTTRLEEKPTHPIDNGGKTQVIGPGERTQVISWADDADQTVVIDLKKERTNEIDGARTQVIRVGSAERTAELDGARTQIIGAGTVEPPGGDRTQVLKVPGERTTVRRDAGRPESTRRDLDHLESTRENDASPDKASPDKASPDKARPDKPGPETTRARSVMAQERPDFAADPTTRITPPGRADDPTTEVNQPKRVMTVTNLERPADEAADDTRHLIPPAVPAPRRPSDDD